ncbi:MAG TPA: ribonuclease H [Gemmatimonadaceae bacterium]|nr:ribonuclease H [Gemmatimonadaceae bacterium]
MSSSSEQLVAIYADESCLGNGRDGNNPGGAGGLIEIRHPRTGEIVRRDYWISEPGTTNNRMALRSAITGLHLISAKGQRFLVQFTSDSRYLVDGMTSWVYDWMRRGWKRKTGTIENLELWQELVEVARAHRVSWRWVRGHAGHPQNEWANVLATRAAAAQTSSPGLVPSGFEAWLAAERARGRMALAPDPLPDPATLSGARALPKIATGSPS